MVSDLHPKLQIKRLGDSQRRVRAWLYEFASTNRLNQT